MEKLKEILSKVRFVYRRTSNITKIIVAVAVVLCLAFSPCSRNLIFAIFMLIRPYFFIIRNL